MKTKTFFLAIVVISILSSFSAFSGNVGETEHKFEVSRIDGLLLGKSAEKIWNIKYSDSSKPITVALRTVPDGKEYVVRTGYVEVVYALGANGFGLKTAAISDKSLPTKVKSSAINKQQVKAQRIISPAQVTDDFALALIGSYLPDLFNGQCQHLIF